MFCCTLLYVHSSILIILMGKRELVALLNLSSWCLVVVERLFLAVPWGSLQFVIVVFPDHTHLLFLSIFSIKVDNNVKGVYWTPISFSGVRNSISMGTNGHLGFFGGGGGTDPLPPFPLDLRMLPYLI